MSSLRELPLGTSYRQKTNLAMKFNPPTADGIYQVEPRTWQDAATIIAAQAAIQLGVSLRGIKGPRLPVAQFHEQA
jgi:hypothetical protein